MKRQGLLYHLYPLNLLGMSNLPPRYQLIYETYAGSFGRGTARPDSDLDLVGVFVPDYEQLYPYKVPGFGSQKHVYTASQTPDMSINLQDYGNLTVDVQGLNVVHLFNLLMKGSPNHVELLFFSDEDTSYSEAGQVLYNTRHMWLTQKFVRTAIAAAGGCMYKNNATAKDYVFSARLSFYAMQAMLHGDLDPLAPRNILAPLLNDAERALTFAETMRALAKSQENKSTTLPLEVDEEVANDVLWRIIRTHWQDHAHGL